MQILSTAFIVRHQQHQSPYCGYCFHGLQLLPRSNITEVSSTSAVAKRLESKGLGRLAGIPSIFYIENWILKAIYVSRFKM